MQRAKSLLSRMPAYPQQASAHTTLRHCQSRAREMLPQLASLADTRGVLRLEGEELIAFLQVCRQAGLGHASILTAHRDA